MTDGALDLPDESVNVPFAGTVMSVAPLFVTRPSKLSVRFVKRTATPFVSVKI